MSAINGINIITQDFETIASLKYKERLHTQSGHISKYSSPDYVTPGKKFFLLSALEHTITVIVKMIQAIGRAFHKQTSEKNIKAIDALADKALNLLKEAGQKTDPEKFYENLRMMGRIRKHVETSISTSLPNYLKTCETGASNLITPSDEKRKNRVEQLKKVIDKIQNQLLPQLNKQIEAMTEEAQKKDADNVKEWLMHLYDKSPKAEKEKKPEAKHFTAPVVKQFLTHLFGKKAVDTILEWYKFHDIVFSKEELIATLAGLTSNLTQETLKHIYGKRTDAIWQFDQKFLDQLPEKFEEMDEKTLCDFLEAVRNWKTSYCLKPQKKSPSRNIDVRPYQKQLSKDLEFLNACKVAKEYRSSRMENSKISHLEKFGFAEYLSRDVVYGLCQNSHSEFADGVLFPMFYKNQWVCRKASPVISQKGLHAIAVTPARLSQSTKKVPVQVVFRGTYCSDSLLRDLSLAEKEILTGFEGPGRKSFNQNKKFILEKVENVVKKVLQESPGCTIKLQGLGHSLGATDAQRLLAAVAEEIDKKKVGNIGGLKLYAFNPPAIENDVASEFADRVSKMPFKANLRYFKTHHDPIQQAGKVLLGHREYYQGALSNMPITLMKFHRRTEANKHGFVENAKQHGLKRAVKLLTKKKLDAHNKHCLWKHDDEKPKKENNTYVYAINTTNPKDAKLAFGANKEFMSSVENSDSLNGKLLTGIGGFCEKINGAVNSFNPWKKPAATPA